MDIAFTLARHIADLGYDQLPQEAVVATKKDILDILGTMAAGSNAPGVIELADLVGEWGGKPESTVVAFDRKVPSPFAAWVNATMGHALDFDDGHDGAVLHAATTVVPAAFAIAQRIGKVDGKAFITAVAAGIDLACRMGLASKKTLKQSGWVYTAIYGFFASAAAAGKLLGLDQDKMTHALGIAYSQAAGNFQSIADAALTKRLQPGFAAKGGLLSALLAQKGVSGIRNSMEGQWGLYNLYQQGDYDIQALTSGLGRRFEVANIGFKAYPSCGYTHNPIEATLALVLENAVKPDDVRQINVYVGENAAELCTPRERKCRPETVPDAQWSIPYAVAAALAKGKVGIRDFTPHAIRDPEVLRIAAKVNPKILPELTRRQVEPAIVEIITHDEKVYSRRVDQRKGSIGNPMTLKELVAKFRDCVSNGRKAIPQRHIERVIRQVGCLEQVDDVGMIIEMLS